MTSKQEALEEIIDIAKRHNLGPEEIERAFRENALTLKAKNEKVITRLLGYLGGIFIFSGVSVFITLQWEVMNSAARIIITLGSGFAALVFALFAITDERYDKAAAPMFIIAALLQPTGIFVAFHEFSTGGDWHLASFSVFAAMLTQQLIVFFHTRRIILLFASLCFASMLLWTLLDWMGFDEGVLWLILGGSLLFVTYAIDKTAHNVIAPFWYVLGAAAFLASAFELVRGTSIEPCLSG